MNIRTKLYFLIGIMVAIIVLVVINDFYIVLGGAIVDNGNLLRQTVFWVALTMIAAGLFLIFSVIRYIADSINEINRGMDAVTRGEFNVDPNIKTNDEIGRLAVSFRTMCAKLREVNDFSEQETKKLSLAVQKLDGQQEAILNILDDVEEGKVRSEQEKKKLDTILENLPIGVVIVNAVTGKIERQNQVSQNIIGQIEGNNARDINRAGKYTIQKEDGDLYPADELPIVITLKTGKPAMKDDLFVSKDKNFRIALSSISAPVLNAAGKIIKAVGIFEDKTEAYRIDKAKTEFVSLASHQLRTPLTSIKWYSEMLLAGDTGKLTKRQKQFVDEIYGSNQRMVALVNALLNVSRLELGTYLIEPEKIDMVEIIISTLGELASQIKEKKLKISKNFKSISGSYFGDPNLLRVVFQNLLSNAVKYTPPKGKIIIDTKKRKSDILFSFSDSGIGIPLSQQEHIFTKLFRADNAKEEEAEGNGLGLYIVKSILHQVGGDIWFESNEKEGTTFFVTLPTKGMKPRRGTKKLS